MASKRSSLPVWKQATWYRWDPGPQGLDLAAWQSALASAAFERCGPQQWMTMGFVPIRPDTSFYIHADPPHYFMRVEEEKKVLPAGVIREAWAERVRVLEATENRPLSRREKRELKETVALALLPQAFTRRRSHWIYVHAEQRLWGVLRSGSGVVASVRDFWRQIFPDHAIRVWAPESSLIQLLEQWLHAQTATHGFDLDSRCQLAHPQTGATIQGQGLDLTDPEWSQWLHDGYRIKKMGLVFQAQLHLVLHPQGVVSACQWPELHADPAETPTGTDPVADDDLEAAATLLIQSDQIAHMIQALDQALEAAGLSGDPIGLPTGISPAMSKPMSVGESIPA